MKQSAAGRSRCPHCGASVDSNEQYCWICGAELNANAHASGRKPSPAEPPLTPPAPQVKPEPEPVIEPKAAPASKATASQTTAGFTASGAAPALKAQPKPTAPQVASGGRAKPSPAKRVGQTKPRAYPRMSVPRNLSDRRDQRAWLLVIPLLAVLASFVYFNDPFKLRASPAANPATSTPAQPILTVVVLQPAPIQPPPVASDTPDPAPTGTAKPLPTATASAEPKAASTTIAPTETVAATTATKATSTISPTRVPSTATPKARATVTPRPPTATPGATATAPTVTPRPPSITPTASLVPGPGPNGTWVVARGDSCARIASQAGVSVEALVQANALQNNCFLRAGQVLIIPTPGPVAATATAAPTVRPTATLPPTPTVGPLATRTAAPAQSTATPLPTIGPPATQEAAATTAAVNGKRSYTVKAGDTCYRISRAENVAVEDLIRVNNLDERCFLSVGQTLALP